MGDVVCALPMINSVRNYYPAAKVILITSSSSRFKEIFTINSPVDEVIYYDGGFEKFVNLINKLRELKIDMAIVPSPVVFSVTNHLIAYFSKARFRIGVRSRDYENNPVSFLLNIKNDFYWNLKKVHQITRNLDVVRQADIDVSQSKIRISLSEPAEKFAENFISLHFRDAGRKIIGFHPGAGKPSNVWPPDKFAELAFLLDKAIQPYYYISEGPDDEKYVGKLLKLLGEKYSLQAVKHKGDILNNIAVISRLDLFITNDTGIMHLVSGLNVPLIALFGETFAWEWGPLGDKKVSFQASGRNISEIEAEEVAEVSLKLLGMRNHE